MARIQESYELVRSAQLLSASEASAGEGGGDGREAHPPNELIDQMLGELDKPELASCCLVSRVFLDLARPRLYRSIEHLVAPVAVEQLWDLLVARPDLARLVRVVDVWLVPEDEGTVFHNHRVNDLLYDDKHKAQKEWVASHAFNIELFLERLENLEQVTPIRLPALTSLTVSELDPAVLSFLPSLDTLEFLLGHGHVEWINSDLVDNIPPILRRLTVHFSPTDYTEQAARNFFDWLVMNSLSTLHTLSFFFDQHFHPSLSIFSALRDLSIILDIGDGPDEIWSEAAFVDALSSLPPPSLTTATLGPALLTSFARQCSKFAPGITSLEMTGAVSRTDWTTEDVEELRMTCDQQGLRFNELQ
ncbi:hypothetical protein JCM8547_007297 [Rhodosporidiobolus lusitaniae]